MKRILCALSMLALCGAAACGGDDNDNPPPDSGTPDSGTPDSGTPDSGTPDAGPADAGSFVAFGIRVNDPNAPTGRYIYLGAYPNQFPGANPDGGGLDTSNLTQFGNIDINYALGDAYVFDRNALTMNEYTVTDAGSIQDAGQFSLLNTGIKANTALSSIYVSEHHEVSYTFAAGSSLLIDWDPSELAVNNSLTATSLSGPTTTLADGGVTTVYNRFGSGNAWVWGNDIAFAISWYNSDFSAINPAAVVALIDKDDITQPITYVTDTRCIGANATFIDPAGDLYVSGTSQNGPFQLFPPTGTTVPDACVLRIKAGTTTFDQSFKVDLLSATGSTAIYDTFYLGGHMMLVIALDPTQAAPTSAATFSATAKWAPFLVDLDTGTGTRMADLPTTGVTQFTQYILDGNLYYQNYNTLSTSSTPANVTAYLVAPDGGVTTEATIPGDIWDMGRMQVH